MRIIAFQPARYIRSLAVTLCNFSCFLLLCALLLAGGVPAFAQVKLAPTINTVAGLLGNGTPNGIALDAAGNLYFADINNNVVYKLAPGATAGTVVAGQLGGGGSTDPSYSGAATGAKLNSPQYLALDGSGNLYIADCANHIVRRVDASGNISTIPISVPGTPPSILGTPNGLAFDTAGNLYVADEANHVIFKVSFPGPVVTIVAGTYRTSGGNASDPGPALSATLNMPTGVAVDGSGNIYISDLGNSVIRKVTFSNGQISTLPSIPGGTLSGPEGLALDAAGDLFISDYNKSAVFEVVNGSGLITVAGTSGTAGNSGDSGPAALALLISPQSVTVDAAGNLYISDPGAHAIRVVNPVFASVTGNSVNFPATAIASLTPATVNVYIQATANETLTSITPLTSLGGKQEFTVGTVTGSGCPGSSGAINSGIICTVPITFTPAYPGQRQVPLQVVTSTGTVSFGLVGTGTGPMVGFTPGVISTVAGNGTLGYTGDGFAATSATFKGTFGVAVDAAGNLYIADGGNNVIRQVDKSGNITTVAINGTGSCAAANLSSPRGVALDSAGNLYIANHGQSVICKVGANGVTTTVAGNGTPGYSGDNGFATNAQLSYLYGVAVDATGNLYIPDYDKHVVRKVSANGIITTVAGNGTPGYTGDNGPATSATLNGPLNVAVDVSGNLYIADFDNGSIRKVDANGIITTIVSGAAFTELRGIAVDASGRLYAADSKSNLISRVGPGGIVATVAGGGSNPAANFTGAATGATLNTPLSVTVDASGSIYFADNLNSIVRKVNMGAASALGFANTAVTLTSFDSPQTVTVQNTGNATLNFLAAVSYPTDFPEDSTGSSDCATAAVASLASGASCPLTIDFVPLSVGPLSENVSITDNALNAASVKQSVAVSGTGLPAATAVVVSLVSPPASSTSPAVNQMVTVSATVSAVSATFTAPFAAAGTFAFYQNGSPITVCGAVVIGAGNSANCSFSPLAHGSYSITAVYSGDANYAATLPAAVTPYSLTIYAAPTTTTLSGTGTLTVDKQLTLTANVTPFNGVPLTGKVTFVDSVTNGVTACAATVPDGSGNAQCIVTLLKAGSHSFTATYNADGADANYLQSASAALPKTILQASTNTLLGTSQSPSTVDQPVTLTATVSAPTGAQAALTGSVTFTDTAAGSNFASCGTSGVVPVVWNSGTATGTASCTTSGLVAGASRNLVATYGSDANYSASSNSVAQTVIKALTTTTLNPTSTGTVDQAVTLSAIVAPTSGASTVTYAGTVAFTANGNSISAACSAAAVNITAGVATATCTSSSLVAGTYPIGATFSGDANYAASIATTVLQTVNPADTKTVLTSTPTWTVGQPAVLTATITPKTGSANVAFAGSVTFLDGANQIAGCTLPVAVVTSAGGVTTATCSATALTQGSHTISATFGSDANYNTSTASLTQSVGTGGTVTTLSAASNSSAVDQPVTFTATVALSSGTPGVALSGSVTFQDGGNPIIGCTSPVAVATSSGVTTAACTATSLIQGAHSITAQYGSDPNYGNSNLATWTQTVSKAATSVTVSPLPNPSVVDQPVTITATINLPTGATVPLTAGSSYTVSFTDNGNTIASCATAKAITLVGAGFSATATCTTSALTAASHTIVATYTGDPNYNGSNNSAVQTVTPYTTDAIALSTLVSGASATSAPINQPVTLSAQVTPYNSSVPLTGTVTFTDSSNGNQPIPGCVVAWSAATGAATCSTAQLAFGLHSVLASYSGDTSYQNVSKSQSFTIGQAATSVIVNTSGSPSNVNQQVIFTATVTAPIGIFTPTGTVAFTDNGTAIPSCPAAALTAVVGSPGNWTASCTDASLTAAGSPHTIKATYSGDTNFAGSNNTVTQNVGTSVTTIKLGSSNAAPPVDQSVTFTATVSAANFSVPYSPISGVTFLDGGNPIAGCLTASPVNATSGVATCIATSLTAGNHSITAVFANDPNYSGVTSSPFTQNVVQANSSITVVSSSPQLVNSPGSPATPTSTVNNSVTFIATINLPVNATVQLLSTGTVSFTDNGTTIPACSTPKQVTLASNGYSATASCITTTLAGGAHAIVATFSGDSNYLGNNSSVPQMVLKNTSSTAITSPAPGATANVNQMLTLTATVTPTGSSPLAPTGTVTFTDAVNSIPVALSGGCAAPAQLNSLSGVYTATCTTFAPLNGSNVITATYNGDGDYNSSFVSTTLAVTQANATINQPTLLYSTSTVNQTQTITANIVTTLPSGVTNAPQLNGYVAFQETVGSNTVNLVCSNGIASITKLPSLCASGSCVQVSATSTATASAICTTSSLLAGSNNTLTTTYVGDSNYTSAAPSTLTNVSVSAATSSLALSASPAAPIVVNDANGKADQVKLTATFSTANAPTSLQSGQVTFSYVNVSPTGGVTTGNLYTTSLTGNAISASYTTTNLPVGTNTVYTTFASGDANFSSINVTPAQVESNNVPTTINPVTVQVQDYGLAFAGSNLNASTLVAAAVTQGFTTASDPFNPQTIVLSPVSYMGYPSATGASADSLQLTGGSNGCVVTFLGPVSGQTPTMPGCTLQASTVQVLSQGTQPSVSVVLDATKKDGSGNYLTTPGYYSVTVTTTDPVTGLTRTAPAFTIYVNANTTSLTPYVNGLPTGIVSGSSGNTVTVTFELPAGVTVNLQADQHNASSFCQYIAGTGISSLTANPSDYGVACTVTSVSIGSVTSTGVTIGSSSSTSYQTVTVTLTLSTNNAVTTSNAAQNGQVSGPSNLLLAGMFGLPILLLAGSLRSRRAFKAVLFRLLAIVALGIAAMQTMGCGGSFTSAYKPVVGTTPPGNYYLLIQGTTGTGVNKSTYSSVFQVNVTL
jgi:sugar lactone lactonase YvrE